MIKHRTRTLKIEESGDFWRRKTHPVIRLKGRWLHAAGFPPGEHLTLTVLSPGVIELRLRQPHELPATRAERLALSAGFDHAIAAADDALKALQCDDGPFVDRAAVDAARALYTADTADSQPSILTPQLS
jgi:hypothetical protein